MSVKNYLSGKQSRAEVHDTDRYKRSIATLYLGETNVNLELVKAGLAWHYKDFNADPQLAAAEDEARRAQRGLWFDANAVPPWEWRKAKKSQQR